MFADLRFTHAATVVVAMLVSVIAIAEEVPDTILINAHVFTSDAKNLHVEALAIRGERILATGSSADIARLAGPKTRSIDLHGATVIPGINDAHNHLDISPSDAVSVALKSENPSWAETRSGLAAAAAKSPPGALLVVEIASKVFHDPKVTLEALDRIAPSNPVMLITFTGHAAILNTAFMTRFGITESQQDPLGGKYERGPDGKLTGVLREYALLQLERSMADEVSDTQATAQLKKQLEDAAAFGITTVQDMSNVATPERAARLMAQIPTPIRVRVMQMSASTPAGRILVDGKPVARNPAPNITVSGIKWMLDGVPLENTFTPRLQPRLTAGVAGLDAAFRELPLTFPAGELPSMLKEALAAHQQLLLHVTGTRSAASMMQFMDASGGAATWAPQRVRFEHGDGLTPDQIPKVRNLGIVVVQNPAHLTGVKQLLGGTLAESQPLKSLLDAGVPLALGSDGPANPYLNILFASLHTNHPSEAITREQAVIAYTAGSAYAEFTENDKGTLEPGKLADLAVLSQDIFKVPPPKLPETTAVLTMVGGKIVYRKSTT